MVAYLLFGVESNLPQLSEGGTVDNRRIHIMVWSGGRSALLHVKIQEESLTSNQFVLSPRLYIHP
jgi:hypothetical protein